MGSKGEPGGLALGSSISSESQRKVNWIQREIQEEIQQECLLKAWVAYTKSVYKQY